MRGARALRFPILAGLLAGAVYVLTMAPGAGATRSSGSSSTVPYGFIAMNADESALAQRANPAKQLKLMHADGVKDVRVQFSWAAAQPYASWKDVPADQRGDFTTGPGDVPTDFAGIDLFVAAAAQAGVSLSPVVEYSPRWDASPKGNHVQPAHDKPYGEFMSGLVKRYGPGGAFWKAYPTLHTDPIVRWQIWNEPELGYFWDTQPFAPSYVALLRVAHRAIKAADPSATILLGALTNHSWDDLRSIYKVHGSRSLFDVVAADPYTRSARGVITILGYLRQVMNQYGDSKKPLVASEVGWPAAAGKTKKQFGFDTTPKGQATKLSQLMPLLAQNRRRLNLGAYYYYTWMSSYDSSSPTPFAFSGLFRLHGRDVCAEPAFSVFHRDTLSEEGRHGSGSVPGRCAS